MISSRQEYVEQCRAEAQKLFSENRMVVQYYRKRKRGQTYPAGVVVAFRDNNDIRVGWSLCHKPDKFNRYIGIHDAVKRSTSLNAAGDEAAEYANTIPYSLLNVFVRVTDRAKKFYKV